MYISPAECAALVRLKDTARSAGHMTGHLGDSMQINFFPFASHPWGVLLLTFSAETELRIMQTGQIESCCNLKNSFRRIYQTSWR